MRQIETQITKHRHLNRRCVTADSLRDGIVLWEMQEKKMQTTPVPRDRCGTVKSGWLETAHPSVEDGKVRRNVCFGSLSTDCGDGRSIFVKNCGSYYIYELLAP